MVDDVLVYVSLENSSDYATEAGEAEEDEIHVSSHTKFCDLSTPQKTSRLQHLHLKYHTGGIQKFPNYKSSFYLI